MKNMKLQKVTLVCIAAFLFSGCEPYPDNPEARMRNQSYEPTSMDIQNSASPRVQVSRIGVFSDNLAYNNKRGVYLIRDTQTGKEYIGVSGIGIQEAGSHHTGKMTTSDER